jgi:hypothetical protein
MAIKPTKPTSPPQALRSNPENFSANAEGWIAYQATAFPNYIDAVADFVDDAADAAGAAAEATADDAAATAADRVQTGLDRTAATSAAAAAGASAGLDLEGYGGMVLAVKDDESGTEFITPGQFPDGTAAAPSITNKGDTDTGIFFPASNTIAFAEGGVEAMRINASGNVGIGTSDPQQLLHLSGGVPDIRYTDTTGAEWRAGNNNGVFRFVNETTGLTHLSIAASGNLDPGGGVVTDADDDGAVASGTYTPTPVGGNFKRITNGGAFTLAAPNVAGDYTLIVQITNVTGAGAITLSGFSKPTGDAFTTVVGDDFFVFVTKCNGFSTAFVQALQ